MNNMTFSKGVLKARGQHGKVITPRSDESQEGLSHDAGLKHDLAGVNFARMR